ncbi:MAG: trypsin-like peptidase domain-containing protein [Oscillospiraceae bacterium]|nr:trypsin-like peptidase domain-containing protein [Oscillospiraceae bacterium]
MNEYNNYFNMNNSGPNGNDGNDERNSEESSAAAEADRPYDAAETRPNEPPYRQYTQYPPADRPPADNRFYDARQPSGQYDVQPSEQYDRQPPEQTPEQPFNGQYPPPQASAFPPAPYYNNANNGYPPPPAYRQTAQPPFTQPPFAQPAYPYQQRPPEQRQYSGYDPAAAPKKNSGGVGFKIFIALISAFVVVAAVVMVYQFRNGSTGLPGSNNNAGIQGVQGGPVLDIYETPSERPADLPDGQLSATDIFKKIQESAVGVLIYSQNSQRLASEGSGIIMGEDEAGQYTYIITCAHVIKDKGSSIVVQLNDGKEHPAEIVGFDTRTDIGVLRIRENGLQAAEFGDSKALEVGLQVYAIGNPGGAEFANSFTSGIVSAIGRPIRSQTGYEMICIQHCAPISPGNSGGALVNSYGQVVGVNSMKIAGEDYEGMGFAVPSAIVKAIVDDIIANGYVPDRPKLGISYSLASENRTYNIIIMSNNLPQGSIIINAIAPDSALTGTDARVNDLITKANGTPLDKPDVLLSLIESSNIGDKLTLTIVRISEDYKVSEFEVTATLVEDKGDYSVEQQTEPQQFTFPEGMFPFD